MVCTYLRDPPDLHGVAWDIARERYLHNIIQFQNHYQTTRGLTATNIHQLQAIPLIPIQNAATHQQFLQAIQEYRETLLDTIDNFNVPQEPQQDLQQRDPNARPIPPRPEAAEGVHPHQAALAAWRQAEEDEQRRLELLQLRKQITEQPLP